MERFAAIRLECLEYSDEKILIYRITGMKRNSTERLERMRYSAEDFRLQDIAEIQDIHSECAHAAVTNRSAVLDAFRNSCPAVVAGPRRLVSGKRPLLVLRLFIETLPRNPP